MTTVSAAAGKAISTFLKEMGEIHGFTVQVVWAVEVDGAVVSSSLIRALLRLGKVTEAGRLLGRAYGVTGRVVQGKGRGAKLLGVPTANILTPNELLPACGIYAVWVRRGDAILPGVANLGTCPTFENAELSLEVHLMEFSGDLYGESLEVQFVTRLREEQRFPSLEALAAQIHADIAAARRASSAALRRAPEVSRRNLYIRKEPCGGTAQPAVIAA